MCRPGSGQAVLGGASSASSSPGEPAVRDAGTGEGAQAPRPAAARQSRTSAFKPGKLTVVLDMDECLLHSKFHGPGGAAEVYRQVEERPSDIGEVNSFWVALDDGDTAQVNKRPGLDQFLEALAVDYNLIVFTAAMPDYAGPVLDCIDPQGTLFFKRLYRSSCRQVKGAFLKDLAALGLGEDLSRTVLVDNNPLSFVCQPTNGILVASFYDDAGDTALANVMHLIRHLDRAPDVRPILKDMFRLDTLLSEYRSLLLVDDEEEEEEEQEDEANAGEGGNPAGAAGGAENGDGFGLLGDEEEEDGEGWGGAGPTAVAPAWGCGSLGEDESGAGGDVDLSDPVKPRGLRRQGGWSSCGGAGGGVDDDDDNDSAAETESCSTGSSTYSLASLAADGDDMAVEL